MEISVMELTPLEKKLMKKAESDSKDFNNRPVRIDCICEIKKFSKFSKLKIEKYESTPFESGGHKWVLVIYPEGNNLDYLAKGHISAYLKLVTDTDMTVITKFRIFLLNYIRKQFFSVGGSPACIGYFDNRGSELGCPKFIPLATFRDPKNGYLVDDKCSFAVEVFVHKYIPTGDYLSMIDCPVLKTFTWKIENFSKAKQQHCSLFNREGYLFSKSLFRENCSKAEGSGFFDEEVALYSPALSVGGPMCQIQLYPRGNHHAKEKFASLFMYFVAFAKDEPSCARVCAKCILRVRNQSSGEHVQKEITDWFTFLPVGWSNFVPLDDLNDQNRGFLVNDTLIVDAEVTVYGCAEHFEEDPTYRGSI